MIILLVYSKYIKIQGVGSRDSISSSGGGGGTCDPWQNTLPII